MEKGQPCPLPGSRASHENPRGAWNTLARREAATVLGLVPATLIYTVSEPGPRRADKSTSCSHKPVSPHR